jgi:hypothetical protein
LKRIHLILLAAMAMCVFASVGASSASAAVEGPLWLVNGVRYDCEKEAPSGVRYQSLLECLANLHGGSGEWRALELTGTTGVLKLDQAALVLASKLAGSGNFTLKTSLITIECTAVHAHGDIIGGNPGRDHEFIRFTGCFVKGKTDAECHVNSPGEPDGSIATYALTELVYLEENVNGEIGDLFSPVSGTTFVELQINGTKCPLFTKGEQEVKGNVVGEASPIATMAKKGVLKFPTSPIGEVFLRESGAWTKISVGLSVFGVVKAAQIGETEVELSSGEEWGVTHT